MASGYQLRERLGGDAHGSVSRAWDLTRRRDVIIKLFDGVPIQIAALQRYAAAATAVRAAKVSGIVAPIEVVTAASVAYVVSPLLAGESLESVLTREGSVQWARAAEIVARCAEILAAITAATGHGHHALRPESVWIAPNGVVRLIGVGMAELTIPAPVQRGAWVLEYRAPEQLEGASGDARTDIFSLAVLLVELTTGVHPFAGATAFQADSRLFAAADGAPELTEVLRGMPTSGLQAVTQLLTRALAFDPDKRHADMPTFVRDLAYARGLSGAPTPVRTRPAAPVAAPGEPPPPEHDTTTIQRPPTTRRPPHLRLVAPVQPSPAPTDVPAPGLLPIDDREPTRAPVEIANIKAPIESPWSASPWLNMAMKQSPQFAAPEIDATMRDAAPRLRIAPPLERTEVLPASSDRRDGDATPIAPPRPNDDDRTLVRRPAPADATLRLPDAGPSRVDAALRLPDAGPPRVDATLLLPDKTAAGEARAGHRPAPAPSPLRPWWLVCAGLFVLGLLGLLWSMMR